MTTGTGAPREGAPDLSYLNLSTDPVAAQAGMTAAAEQLMGIPMALLKTAEVMLTVDDAVIAATPKEVVWTHRKTTLYRYHSAKRTHAIPILLVFALINRPHVFDLRPGNSFVEFLLDEGYDVFLVDWGVPGEEDDDLGVADYVCDELHWAVRETLRRSGQDQVSMVGWCIGATLAAMYTAVHAELNQVRNLVVLTMPVDTTGSTYEKWVNRDSFDVDTIVSNGGVPGAMIDVANRMLKPVTNFVTTRRKVFDQVRDGTLDRVSYQSMSKWVQDNPPFPAKSYHDWITWMYKENRLINGTMELRTKKVDFGDIVEASVLVVTASADHIAPRNSTMPFMAMCKSKDLTHFDRKGGHIGLMAGSKARHQIWPDISGWLAERSGSRS
ncbi:MAG: alpha/beta fold hydrolase [Kineosporiaceae bacterium]|nr:alpha/beta fold hydrolase [Kineosporiaceae bacterium]